MMLAGRTILTGLIAILFSGAAWGEPTQPIPHRHSRAPHGHSAHAPAQPAQAPGAQAAQAPNGQSVEAPGAGSAETPQGQAPQAPSQEPAATPAPDQRGTVQMPLTVRVLPGEDAKETAESEERQIAEIARADKRLAEETQKLADQSLALSRYIGGMAAFTLFLIAAGLGQVALFWLQSGVIRDNVGDAKMAAEAARIGAEEAQQSAEIAKTSAETAIAFERPYVRIREIKASVRGHFLSRIRKRVFPKMKILKEPYAICVIENYGRTPAFVERTDALLRFSADDLEAIPEKAKPIPVVTLKTGQSYRFEVALGKPLTQERAEMIESEEASLWLHFDFVYRDVLGKIHQTTDKWNYDFVRDSFGSTLPYTKAT